MTSLAVGSLGLSAYLIPYIFSDLRNNKKLNTLFLASDSSYREENIDAFKKKEKDRLNELTILFEKLDKVLKDSKELKNLINDKVLGFFKSIIEAESSLKDLFQKHLENLDKLSKVFWSQFYQEKEKISKQYRLGIVKNSKNLITQMNKWSEEWNKYFEEFIKNIEEGSKNSEVSSQGGAVPIREMQARKQKKS